MDIKQLKIFCAVVEKGSFSKAAEMLILTQPTVSFQIASLEKEMGTKLLDRSGREVTLTRSGEALYHYALRMLQLADEARQAIDEVEGLLKGKLVIAASTIPGEYILPSLLPEFKEKYPGIEISLMITDTRGAIGKIMDNEAEIGAVGAKEKDEKLVFVKFTTDKLVLIAPSTGKWFKQGSVALENLRGVPFISRESGSGTRAIVKQGLKDMGMSEEELDIIMELGSIAAVKGVVESGAGVAIVSQRAVKNEIKLGLLREVPLKSWGIERDFFLVYKRQKSLSPIASAFLQFMQEQENQPGVKT